MNKDQVSSVKSVEIALEGCDRQQLRITAHGVVPTSGWSQPELVAYVYIQAPPDGIYDFSFVAVQPSGPVLQVLQPISVTQLIDCPPELRGVRIHAARDTVEALLDRYETAPSPLKNA